MLAMLGCCSDARICASRSNRAMRSGSEDTAGCSALMATSRLSLVSRARYTSPIPPAPSAPVISYGPIRVPAGRDIAAGVYAISRGRLALTPKRRDRRDAYHSPARPLSCARTHALSRPERAQILAVAVSCRGRGCPHLPGLRGGIARRFSGDRELFVKMADEEDGTVTA